MTTTRMPLAMHDEPQDPDDPARSLPREGAGTGDPTGPAEQAPRRTILVDGFNVLHAVLLGKERDGWWRRAPRERLLERVQAWDGGPDEIWVAFDGTRPAVSAWAYPVATSSPDGEGWGRSRPIVHSVFVESADDWIVRRARRAEQPERLTVVSADRKVAGRARSAGCEILTPWAFIARCPIATPGDAASSLSVGC